MCSGLYKKLCRCASESFPRLSLYSCWAPVPSRPLPPNPAPPPPDRGASILPRPGWAQLTICGASPASHTFGLGAHSHCAGLELSGGFVCSGLGYFAVSSSSSATSFAHLCVSTVNCSYLTWSIFYCDPKLCGYLCQRGLP